jgi:hypothetical protein
VKPPRSLGLQQTWEAVQRHLEIVSKTLSNISFGTTVNNTDPDMNMQCWKATGTTPASPNTEFAVTHNLKHVPIGFMIVSTNKAAHIYKSTTAWTAATTSTMGSIFLKCDTATVAFAIVIL